MLTSYVGDTGVALVTMARNPEVFFRIILELMSILKQPEYNPTFLIYMTPEGPESTLHVLQLD